MVVILGGVKAPPLLLRCAARPFLAQVVKRGVLLLGGRLDLLSTHRSCIEPVRSERTRSERALLVAQLGKKSKTKQKLVR